jgi:hypothetical protein
MRGRILFKFPRQNARTQSLNDTSAGPQNADQARRRVAIGLLGNREQSVLSALSRFDRSDVLINGH